MWEEQGTALFKEFTFSSFLDALRFVNRVGELAEEMRHHPDILLHDYNKVRIVLTTHDAGAVTQKDRDLAERIDAHV